MTELGTPPTPPRFFRVLSPHCLWVVENRTFSLALDAKAAKPLRCKGSRVVSNKTIP